MIVTERAEGAEVELAIWSPAQMFSHTATFITDAQ